MNLSLKIRNSHIGNAEHGHGARLLESVAAGMTQDSGKSCDEIFKQVCFLILLPVVVRLISDFV